MTTPLGMAEVLKLWPDPHQAIVQGLVGRGLNPIVVAFRGSVAHGMYVRPEDPGSTDDVDLIAVYVSPLSYYFGMGSGPQTVEIREGRWDVVAYELRHFLHLLEKGNPNVLSLLWTPPLMSTLYWGMLQAQRTQFVTQNIFPSFIGYAHAQLHRMTAAARQTTCCIGEVFHVPDCPENRTKGRGSQKKFATGHLGEKRKGLVEKFGYDTKNAAHCIRLIRLGLELATTNGMTVDRRVAGDAEELLKIKLGEHTAEEVANYADLGLGTLKQLREVSQLPEAPNRGVLDQLLKSILARAHLYELRHLAGQGWL